MSRAFTLQRIVLLAILIILGARCISLLAEQDYWKESITSLKNKWKSSTYCDLPPLEPDRDSAGISKPIVRLNITQNLDTDPTIQKEEPLKGRRANAAFVFLARNSELKGVIKSMQSMEDRFNKKYNYPYVFLNDEPFSDEFKEWTSRLTSSKTEYGVIPKDHWNQPDWIDENKAKAAREKMVDENIIYGGSVSYRNMCRFNSGFFFRHELVQPYRWYWRIEPGIDFYCDLDYDPFLSMEDSNQVYGFNIALYEFEETIPTLWKTTKEFIEKHPQYVAKGNAMGFISKDKGKSYSLCHFWSNFEIADMEFWRGEAYTAYFDWLESKGGFYYERWGDAPVHSIAAALFLKKEQIRFFDEIGYRHDYIQHCPSGDAHKQGRCSCAPDDSFDWDYYSCLWEFAELFN